MLKKILVGLAVVIVAILAFAATRPPAFRVERTATIKAPSDSVFALVNDFHAWQQWSPWEKLDPNMKRTITGPPSGKGAIYEWSGNSDVGAGRMEIVESNQPSEILIKMHFLEPLEAQSMTEFSFAPQGDSTKITWAMYGENNYLAKLMHMFMNMDSMIGKDFEAGLAKIKTLAEG
jgi:hypothetical protein